MKTISRKTGIRLICFLMLLITIFAASNALAADVPEFTNYSDGDEIDLEEEGSKITFKWEKISGVDYYLFAARLMPKGWDYGDKEDDSTGEKIVNNEKTTSKSYSIKTKELKENRWLKVAVGAYFKDGDQKWKVIYVYITRKEPAPTKAPKPSVNLSAKKSKVDQGDTVKVTLTAKNTHHYYYEVKDPDGTKVMSETKYDKGMTIQFTAEEAGTYTVYVVGTNSGEVQHEGDSSQNGDRDEDTVKITVKQKNTVTKEPEPTKAPKPSVKLSAKNTTVNQGDTVKVTLTAKNTDHYYYEVTAPDGTQVTRGTKYDEGMTVQFTGEKAGTYTVYVVGTNSEKVQSEGNSSQNGDRDEATLEITVKGKAKKPSVKLSAKNTTVNQGDTVKVTLTAKNTDHYYYEVKAPDGTKVEGGTKYDDGMTVQFTAEEAGIYTVYAVGTNSEVVQSEGDSSQNGDRDEATLEITVKGKVKKPSVKLSAKNTTVNQGDTVKVTLTAKNTDHYYYEVTAPDGAQVTRGTKHNDGMTIQFTAEEVGIYTVYVVGTNSEEVQYEGDSSQNGDRDEDALDIIVKEKTIEVGKIVFANGSPTNGSYCVKDRVPKVTWKQYEGTSYYRVKMVDLKNAGTPDAKYLIPAGANAESVGMKLDKKTTSIDLRDYGLEKASAYRFWVAAYNKEDQLIAQNQIVFTVSPIEEINITLTSDAMEGNVLRGAKDIQVRWTPLQYQPNWNRDVAYYRASCADENESGQLLEGVKANCQNIRPDHTQFTISWKELTIGHTYTLHVAAFTEEGARIAQGSVEFKFSGQDDNYEPDPRKGNIDPDQPITIKVGKIVFANGSPTNGSYCVKDRVPKVTWKEYEGTSYYRVKMVNLKNAGTPDAKYLIPAGANAESVGMKLDKKTTSIDLRDYGLEKASAYRFWVAAYNKEDQLIAQNQIVFTVSPIEEINITLTSDAMEGNVLRGAKDIQVLWTPLQYQPNWNRDVAYYRASCADENESGKLLEGVKANCQNISPNYTQFTISGNELTIGHTYTLYVAAFTKEGARIAQSSVQFKVSGHDGNEINAEVNNQEEPEESETDPPVLPLNLQIVSSASKVNNDGESSVWFNITGGGSNKLTFSILDENGQPIPFISAYSYEYENHKQSMAVNNVTDSMMVYIPKDTKPGTYRAQVMMPDFTKAQCKFTVVSLSEIETLAEYAVPMLVHNEADGNYGIVKQNDNGAMAIGIIQWNGSRAKALLRTIATTDPSLTIEILGSDLYNEICNTSINWSQRTATSDEAKKISKLLKTEIGREVQEAGALENCITAVTRAKEHFGFTDPEAILYYVDSYQWPDYADQVAAEAIRAAGSPEKVTLEVYATAYRAHKKIGDDCSWTDNTKYSRTLYVSRHNYCEQYIPSLNLHVESSEPGRNDGKTDKTDPKKGNTDPDQPITIKEGKIVFDNGSPTNGSYCRKDRVPEVKWEQYEGTSYYRVKMVDLKNAGTPDAKYLIPAGANAESAGMKLDKETTSIDLRDYALEESSAYRFWVAAYNKEDQLIAQNQIVFTVSPIEEINITLTSDAMEGNVLHGAKDIQVRWTHLQYQPNWNREVAYYRANCADENESGKLLEGVKANCQNISPNHTEFTISGTELTIGHTYTLYMAAFTKEGARIAQSSVQFKISPKENQKNASGNEANDSASQSNGVVVHPQITNGNYFYRLYPSIKHLSFGTGKSDDYKAIIDQFNVTWGYNDDNVDGWYERTGKSNRKATYCNYYAADVAFAMGCYFPIVHVCKICGKPYDTSPFHSLNDNKVVAGESHYIYLSIKESSTLWCSCQESIYSEIGTESLTNTGWFDSAVGKAFGWVEVSETDAIQKANEGYMTLGIWSGHMFVVYPHGDNKQMYISEAGAECRNDVEMPYTTSVKKIKYYYNKGVDLSENASVQPTTAVSSEKTENTDRTGSNTTVSSHSAGNLQLADILEGVSNSSLSLCGTLNGKADQGRYDGAYKTCHDFTAAEGTKLYAPMDGTIVCTQVLYKPTNGTKRLYSYGNLIEMTSSDNRFIFIFAHLQSFEGVSTTEKWVTATEYKRSSEVPKNLRCSEEKLTKEVKKGDLIGYTGNTGHSDGAHLHIEVYEKVNGKNVKLYPCAFFKKEELVYQYKDPDPWY